MISRREILRAGAVTAGGMSMLAASVRPGHAAPQPRRSWQESYSGGPDRPPLPPGIEGKDYQPVIVPNGFKVPWKIVDGVKVYHLIAEEVDHEFAPGLRALCWGYNGTVNGPVIEGLEGERIRIYVTNKLAAPTTIHPHGVFLPNGMDGVGGLNMRSIQPGETFKYEWTWKQHGTFMFHSHHDEMTQIALGLTGLFVVHPRKPVTKVDRDFALLLHEWKIVPGAARPDPNEMTDFNIFTINGKAFPGTAPLVARKGDRVRIRIGNLGPMDHHPIHIHGHFFKIVETDGGAIPPDGQWPETMVLVPVGSTRTVEFIADNPGDWALHCHMTHHIMNQMGHAIPNMIGVDPEVIDARVQSLLPEYMTMGQTGMAEHGLHIEKGHMAVPANSIPMVGAQGPYDYITMGGMSTIVKVRENLASYDEDPGWYQHPPGTTAAIASEEEIKRDLGAAPDIQVLPQEAMPGHENH